ncbi:GntR family transcriptional regulator [Afifella aestuarii]|uniref:GntR family transcriptional regulator n=1 Tax=Afifella aestuarii TaxID=1909496 RepID=UPI001FE3FB62|nr:GntR family transcriptional regulator [Afifella aestuarii]
MSTIAVRHGDSSAAILERLRTDILAGRLVPGERLGEVALARRFEVSRGPVREALRLLADAGLVSFTPNVGARVRELSLADARVLYELREALEAEAARLAALRATPEEAQDLGALLKQHAGEIAAHPVGAYFQSGGDADFHIVIARLSGNPLILRLLDSELYPQLSLLRRRHGRVQGRGREALIEHERIQEAIAAGDGELAGLLMRRHIRASWTSLAGELSQEEER